MKEQNNVNELAKKKRRSKTEMDAMMEQILVTAGPCFATRLLAWCNGGISTIDLYHSLKEECPDFVVPEIVL